MAWIERVVVTGAAGRIGRELVPRLAEEFEVWSLDREDCSDLPNPVHCDVADLDALIHAFRGMDAVIHLAGAGGGRLFHEDLVPANIVGAYNAFEAAARTGVRRFVFASSAHVVGGNLDDGDGVDEDVAPRPDSIYAVTKLFGEGLARYYAERRGLSTICARIGWHLPEDAEELEGALGERYRWVSPEDMARFVTRCLRTPRVSFAVLNCTSANLPRPLSLTRSRAAIGFRPRDGFHRRWVRSALRSPGPKLARFATRAREAVRRRVEYRFPSLVLGEEEARPLFVVGTIRGGTTILARCLGAHPGLSYRGFEFTAEWQRLSGLQFSTASTGTRCRGYTESEASPTRSVRLRRGLAQLFHSAHAPEDTRWVLKNPHLWNKLDFLRAVFPDAQLVATGRDLRSTVASLKSLWSRANARRGTRYHLPVDPTECWRITPPAIPPQVPSSRVFPDAGVSLLAEYWLRTHEALERSAPKFERASFVRHRDLVSDPEAALAPVLAAAGLAGSRADLTLDATRVDDWEERLSDRDLAELDDFVEAHRRRIEALTWADTTL